MAPNMLWFENNGAPIDVKNVFLEIKYFWARLGESRQNSFAPPIICLLLHLWFLIKQNKLAKAKIKKTKKKFVIRKSIFISSALPSPIFAHKKRRKPVLSFKVVGNGNKQDFGSKVEGVHFIVKHCTISDVS